MKDLNRRAFIDTTDAAAALTKDAAVWNTERRQSL